MPSYDFLKFSWISRPMSRDHLGLQITHELNAFNHAYMTTKSLPLFATNVQIDAEFHSA